MRITGGKYRSRMLKTLGGDHTRPTLDKVKEAVFSRTGPYFDGGIGLDLFSGSGAIGLELLSRGMDKVWMNDNDHQAVQIIKENVNALGEKNAKVIKASYQKTLENAASQKVQFRFIYLDPPYHTQKIEEILDYIDKHELLDPHNGDIVVECLKEITFPDRYDSFVKVKEALYGITKITYYKAEKGE